MVTDLKQHFIWKKFKKNIKKKKNYLKYSMRPPVIYLVLSIGDNKESDIIGCWYFLPLLLQKPG